MDAPFLTKLGMTRIEALIYFELLKTGETPIGHLIKRTGLHRGTVYNSLSSLIKKGFVSFIDKDRTRYYKHSGEKIFDEIINEKERDLQNERGSIQEFFKRINSLMEKESKQEINVFYGVEAFKSLFLEVYDKCKKNDWEYLFQGKGGEMMDIVGEGFYKYTQELKKRMSIKCRILLDSQSMKLPYGKYVHGNIKYVSSRLYTPVNFWIYGDTILLVLFGTNPLTTIKIRSRILADGFKNYFEHIWSMPIDLRDRATYSASLVTLVREAKNFSILCKNPPFILYPLDKAGFLKYRKSVKKKRATITGNQDLTILTEYIGLWKRCSKTRYLIPKLAIKDFFNIIKKDFGDGELKRRLTDIKNNMKKYNIKIRIIDGFNPMLMYISEKQLMMVMIHSEEVYGFVTSKPEVRNMFMQIYEEYWNKAYPLEDYIKKYCQLPC